MDLGEKIVSDKSSKDIIDSLDRLYELLGFDIEYIDNRIALVLPECYEDDELKSKLNNWAEYTKCLNEIKETQKELERLEKKRDNLKRP